MNTLSKFTFSYDGKEYPEFDTEKYWIDFKVNMSDYHEPVRKVSVFDNKVSHSFENETLEFDTEWECSVAIKTGERKSTIVFTMSQQLKGEPYHEITIVSEVNKSCFEFYYEERNKVKKDE